MNDVRRPVTVVGCGPGDPHMMTQAARRAVRDAAVVAGAPSILDAAAPDHPHRIPWRGDTRAFWEAVRSAAQTADTAVLVSGDPCVASLAGTRTDGAVRVIPGIGAVQAALAALGCHTHCLLTVSGHARAPDLPVEAAVPCEVVAVLLGHPDTWSWVRRVARAKHCAVVHLCHAVGRPHQRIVAVPVHCDVPHIPPLSVAVITTQELV